MTFTDTERLALLQSMRWIEIDQHPTGCDLAGEVTATSQYVDESGDSLADVCDKLLAAQRSTTATQERNQ